MSDVNGANPAANIAQQLRDLIEEHQQALAQIESERQQIVEELRGYEKAIVALTGSGNSGPGRPRKLKSRAAGASVPTGLSDERLSAIADAIRSYAADHEEFRQVDIRSMPGLPEGLAKSSVMAQAFELLRQEPHNLIRLARKAGNNKYFRLTNAALAAHHADRS